ncbi:MAG: T9SS C-terminal target domain-containing protein [Bacteroidetes bacterium]|nr:MAG: T9SS C-terminal target domain-containing protein [Bacteroidota bacterium]
MRLFTLCCFLILFEFSSCAQAVSWEEMAPMPEVVSNNAVTQATVGGTPFVFSFAGIDASKDWDGIHLRSYRYDVENDLWEAIYPLPDPNGGKIAAGASTVKNKIYIIGGYHVASNYSEISSDKVHIYDPETDAYLPDGAPVPTPIDDQVQAVWRDSLIYVITGWSNTTNVSDVQIYNPATDTWLQGTPVFENSNWKVFGGSGTIIGDTIYYSGGAKSVGNFPASAFFRKGYINPDNPAEITWEGSIDNGAIGYRMAASDFEGKPVWFGGSDVTYNFDGIAYNGSGGVPPNERISYYDPETGILAPLVQYFVPVMDLRGIGKIASGEYIIAGGMKENQTVTNRTLKVTINEINAVESISFPVVTISPNPASDFISIEKQGEFAVEISDLTGKIVLERKAVGNKINISNLPDGEYVLSIVEKGRTMAVGKFVVVR